MTVPPAEPPVLDTLPSTVPPLLVDIIGDGGRDWLAIALSFVGPLLALLAVFLGARWAGDRLEKQINAARIDAQTRWERERGLEERKWEAMHRRDMYARHLGAVSAFAHAVRDG